MGQECENEICVHLHLQTDFRVDVCETDEKRIYHPIPTNY